MKPLLVVIAGPTGIGKTSTGIELAQHFKSEIISADSRQFFKEMKIGTAVPTSEELEQVKHYFIQNLSIEDNYNASSFEEDALKLLDRLFKKNKLVFMVGGSGLYIDAVCSGIDYLPTIPAEVRSKYQTLFEEKGINEIRRQLELIDPEYYNKVDKQNPKRILKALEVFAVTNQTYTSFLKNKKKERPFHILKIVLDMDRTELYNRINHRVDLMMSEGLEAEAKELITKKDLTPLKTVGYKELFEYFEGKISLVEATTQIQNHSRAYARRQLTWFRRYDDIHWFEPKDKLAMINLIDMTLSNRLE